MPQQQVLVSWESIGICSLHPVHFLFTNFYKPGFCLRDFEDGCRTLLENPARELHIQRDRRNNSVQIFCEV
jgi:hypothetical protein